MKNANCQEFFFILLISHPIEKCQSLTNIFGVTKRMVLTTIDEYRSVYCFLCLKVTIAIARQIFLRTRELEGLGNHPILICCKRNINLLEHMGADLAVILE